MAPTVSDGSSRTKKYHQTLHHGPLAPFRACCLVSSSINTVSLGGSILPSCSFSGAPSQPEGVCPHCSGPVPPGLDLGAPLEVLSGNASPTREASGPVGGGGASAGSGVWGYPPGGDQGHPPRGQLVHQAVRSASQMHPSGGLRHRYFPLPSRFPCVDRLIHLSIHMLRDICVVSGFGGLLLAKLLQTLVYRSEGEYTPSFLLGKYRSGVAGRAVMHPFDFIRS